MNRNIIIILALAVLSLAALSCGSEESTQAAVTTAVPETPELPEDVQAVGTAVNPEPAATGTIVNLPTEITGETIVATGEFVSPVSSAVAPAVGGRVARMYVDEGSRVTRGQPVLELETDYANLNVQSAEAEVERAKALLDEAGRDMERKKELIDKGSIPQATFDRSQAMFDQARAAHTGATARAAMMRQQLADSTVRSPINGVVAEKRTDVGQHLGDGDVAMVIVQISPLKLRFAVPERYLGKIQRGQTVTARVDPYPAETFTGTIKTVGGVIDPRTRTMFAEAEFRNADGRLRPGLFARVEAKLN